MGFPQKRAFIITRFVFHFKKKESNQKGVYVGTCFCQICLVSRRFVRVEETVRQSATDVKGDPFPAKAIKNKRLPPVSAQHTVVHSIQAASTRNEGQHS